MFKNILFFFLKPLSFLPALAVMAMIFSFSSQNGTESGSLSYRVSYKIVDAGSQLLNKDLEPWQKDAYATKIEGPVRKAAHITEYFILAITVALPLYVYGLRGFPLLLVAGALCVGFACTDEYHQSFVSGRSPSVRDVCIDSIGVFFGIMLVRILCWLVLTPSRISKNNQRKLTRYK
ncbi:MAG: VanZ family protein [Frisingicoccus sp.]|uniref:VanZ family protein n=1 Tax=Frisingicoccus sp. TaxID=1918627 RepID=UPI0025C0FE13|nr:VanZ family protein [Frisingicoccus sp.]MDY4834121.1 VanZ family protein [Frisingicoccus sp.]